MRIGIGIGIVVVRVSEWLCCCEWLIEMMWLGGLVWRDEGRRDFGIRFAGMRILDVARGEDKVVLKTTRKFRKASVGESLLSL